MELFDLTRRSSIVSENRKRRKGNPGDITAICGRRKIRFAPDVCERDKWTFLIEIFRWGTLSECNRNRFEKLNFYERKNIQTFHFFKLVNDFLSQRIRSRFTVGTTERRRERGASYTEIHNNSGYAFKAN